MTYTNAATATAIGDVVIDGEGPVTATTGSSSTAVIKQLAGGSGGMIAPSKSWNVATVNAQSGDAANATVRWGTEISGYTTATVTEPADPSAAVSSTVFQAFNLTRINAITTATDPLIAYDRVTKVELFASGAAQPTDITSKVCTSAAVCQGKMPAYSLSTAEQASTVGVRITFAEWAGGRTTDPLAPPVGSGVASGPDSRAVTFVFQLRNTLRDASGDPAHPWVTGSRTYNDADAGVVTNTAGVALDAQTGTASADLLVLDTTPGVALTKTVAPTAVAIPVAGDIPDAAYPSTDFTLTANNTAPAKAWALRVTDQAPCAALTPSDCAHPSADGVSGWTVDPYAGATWNPATSPFDAFTITKIVPSGYTGSTGIDATASGIELWYADGHTATVGLTSSTLTSASALRDVVGVSVLWIGSSQADGGTIVSTAKPRLTITAQLRPTLRSSPATPVTPRTITNTAFAESWDGVLDASAAYITRSVDLTLSDAALAVTTAKSFSPSALLEKDRANPVTVTLTAGSNGATASPDRLVVQDTRPEFWNAVRLGALGAVALPTGANRVEVDVQLNGSSTWTTGTAAASAALPDGVDTNAVTGIRFVFTNDTTDPSNPNDLFSITGPAAAWTASAAFTVTLRPATRDTGAVLAFPSTLPDDVTATVGNPHLADRSATNTATLSLNPGTFTVDISTTPDVATSPAGQTINWTLVMTNTGTGYLTNPVVTDQLPADGALVFDPTSEITSATSTGGLLPTSGQSVAFDATSKRITVTWPAGSRMAPGEKVTLVIPIAIQPGLQASHGAIPNQFRFSSDRALSACTNSASGNGQPVTFTAGGTSCLTQNSVSTISASAISSFKGVKGDVDGAGESTRGAVNVNNAATPCVADPQGYYRQPCAANTVVGATDQWKLQIVNGGNVPATAATVVDVLPKPGDSYLRSGASRGTTFRPVFAGGVTLATDDLSAGAAMSWQGTTSADPCPSYDTDSSCSTATWVDGATMSATQLARVTAIRIVFDFTSVVGASPSGTLPPAATVAVTYRTVNQPSTTASDKLAPTTVPLGTAQAWNSFGVWAKFGAGYADRRVEPARAGVQLLTGPLQVTKAIIGAGAAYAPVSYAATATCTVAGAPVTLPSGGALTLASATGYTARIDGIPVGADCGIVESPSGASSTSYSPAAASGTGAGIAVTTAAGSADAVPPPSARRSPTPTAPPRSW
ncbi:hypothetical protein GCM10025881_24230 [Pseudolysinimonas kribbensis]|uniref:DUF11 domain-containing protein n=1 Tax=Pseudolysinimonas kribbensis TaxID=433641 RepID=A0ABQ6K8I6_9MICO|nr:DUF5979 domain-containing protein [Pseudolysinimonas kribbensis]GMA95599.1 hypothetical protein GCM10025881_24230 [Pseudolysinimonas kribbensis]